jgi:hypothetical protein
VSLGVYCVSMANWHYVHVLRVNFKGGPGQIAILEGKYLYINLSFGLCTVCSASISSQTSGPGPQFFLKQGGPDFEVIALAYFNCI